MSPVPEEFQICRGEYRQAAGATESLVGVHQLTPGRLTHWSLSLQRLGALTTRAVKNVNLRHLVQVDAAYQRHGAVAVRACQFGCVGCGHGEVHHDEVREGSGPGGSITRPGPGIRPSNGISAANRLLRYICGVLMEKAIGRQFAQQRRGPKVAANIA